MKKNLIGILCLVAIGLATFCFVSSWTTADAGSKRTARAEARAKAQAKAAADAQARLRVMAEERAKVATGKRPPLNPVAAQTATPFDIVVPPYDFCSPAVVGPWVNAYKVGNPHMPNLWWVQYGYMFQCFATGTAGCALTDELYIYHRDANGVFQFDTWWSWPESAGCGQSTNILQQAKVTLTPGTTYLIVGASWTPDLTKMVGSSPSFVFTP